MEKMHITDKINTFKILKKHGSVSKTVLEGSSPSTPAIEKPLGM